MFMVAYDIPWDEKKDKVYFHGALTGISYGPDGEFINRLKLLHLAHQNPDHIHFGLSDALD
jgi:hypothetical protein